MMNYACPIPKIEKQVITMAHGSGGKQSSDLIQKIFLPLFNNESLNLLHDGAELFMPESRIIMTTDSYVVQPIFFPGGDIGKLAVTGTINDIAMCGGKALYLSCGFIIEEGFSIDELQKIAESMQLEAQKKHVQIVTGDTKVIERNTGGNIFINTTGIGIKMTNHLINPLQIKNNDVIILSGDIGRHGMAIMAAREGLTFSEPFISDCAPLTNIISTLLEHGIEIHCLRDLTRGGLASALVELSESSQHQFLIDESTIPVCAAVNSACELLGLEPLYVANEGRFMMILPETHVNKALGILHTFSDSSNACVIGNVVNNGQSTVKVKNEFGTERYLDKLIGDQLPRIC